VLQYTGVRYWDEFNAQTDIIDGLTGAVQANDAVGVGLVTNYIGTKDPVLDYNPNVLYVNVPHNVLVDLPGITTVPAPLDGAGVFASENVPRTELITTNASSLENEIIEEVTNAPSISTVKGLYIASTSGIPVITILAGTSSATVKKDLSSYPSAIEASIASDVTNGFTITLPTKEISAGSQNRWTGAVYYEEKYTSSLITVGFIINNGVLPAHGGSEDDLPEDPAYPLSSAPTITQEQTGGDPIGLASGNVQHSETDVSLPDFGHPLSFSRLYNSFQTTDNGLGIGWTSNYGDYLIVSALYAIWYSSDGHVYSFPLVNGAFQTPVQLSGMLTSANGMYTYAEKGGLIRRFQDVSESGVVQLVEMRDRNNNALEITHDSAGKIMSVYDLQNPTYALTLTYDGTNHLSQVQDPTGRVWNYTCTQMTDGRFYLTGVNSPSDTSTPKLVTTYTYYSGSLLDGLLNTVTRADATDAGSARQTTTFTYYPDRRGFQVTDPDGDTTDVNYKLFRTTAEFVDERGDVTTTVYSPKTGLTLKQVNPDQTRELYTWTPIHSLLASHTDTFGDQTIYSYDYGPLDTGGGVGNLIQSVDGATGTTTNNTYEPATEFYQVATITVTAGGTSEVTRFAHDANGNTISITDPAGGVATMTYGPRGEVLTRTAPDGVGPLARTYTTNFSYNTVGQVLTTTELGLNATTTDSYDSHYALLSVTGPTGIVTTFTNDLLGRRLSQTLPDPDGSGPLGPLVTTYKLDAFSNLLNTTDPRGLLTQNVFDAKNELVETINSDGTESTNQYDPAGNLVETTDPLGKVTLFVVDSMGRKVEVVNPDDTSRFMTYAANGAVALAVDENGQTTANAYDLAGRLSAATDANGNVVRNTYDGFNNLLVAALYPAGMGGLAYSATTYQHDLLNRVIELQGPQGMFQTLTYDADGNVIKQVQFDVTGDTYDAAGLNPGLTDGQGNPIALSSLPPSQQHVTTTAYDVADRPVLVSEPALTPSSSALTTATAYDAGGRVLSTTDQGGFITTHGYDLAGREVSVTAPNPTNAALPGLTTTFTLDADGNTVVTTDPSGRVTTDTYNQKSNGLIAETSGTASTYITSDADGNTVATTDGDGNRTTDARDALNRVVTETQTAPGGTVTNVYYPNSELHKTIDANGRLVVFKYDGLGRKTAEIWYATNSDTGPALNTITWNYNPAGQLASVSDNSGTTSFTYDRLNRVVTRTNANVTQNVSQPVVRYTFRYDGFGNVVERDTAVGGVTVQTITSQYDADNRLTQQTAVTPGNFKTQTTATTQQVNYTLNADGQPTTISRYQSTGGGALALVATTTLAYNNDGRVTSILHQQGTATLDSYQYTYNSASQITGVVTGLDGSTAFTYDTAGEVATATYSANASFNESFGFDGAGNNSANTTAGDNRLMSDGTFSYTYDLAGSMITRTRVSSAAANDYLTLYTWDNRNRLTEVVTENNQGTVTQDVKLAYDVENRRIAETVNGVSIYFFYSADGNVALTLNDSGVATAVLYGPDNLEVSEVDASNNVRWMLADAQGSVRDVVILNGTTAQVADHVSYNSFGKVLTETSPATPHLFGYAGQQPDAAVLLNYAQARYYNPQTGRFVSQDPSGLAAGDANLYRYVFNDPVDFVDPTGLHIELPSAVDNTEYFDANGPSSIPVTTDLSSPGFESQLLTRVGGALQALIGLGLTDTGIGAVAGLPIMYVGVDNFIAGGETLLNGVPTQTTISQGVQTLAEAAGDSSQTAYMIGELANGAAGIAISAPSAVYGVASLLKTSPEIYDTTAAESDIVTVTRTTRSGETAIRQTFPDGSIIDISPQRVKEFVLETDPRAPEGTLQEVRFSDSLPGSKGLKRAPTAAELELLRNAK
jgi:RHS repeat-associated protein